MITQGVTLCRPNNLWRHTPVVISNSAFGVKTLTNRPEYACGLALAQWSKRREVVLPLLHQQRKTADS